MTTPPRALYPLNQPLPIWRHECHSDGVALWVDDPAELFSGVEAATQRSER